MIKIKIIALGKLKESYLRDASKEYEKRLCRYCDLEISELNPVKLSDNPSYSEINSALENEAESIIKNIPNGSRVITMCVEGKALSSEEFAENIKNYSNCGEKLTFIIGSSYGLADKIKKISDKKLSVSAMTFPHQLFRIMLLEQLYRAFKICEGSTYHK